MIDRHRFLAAIPAVALPLHIAVAGPNDRLPDGEVTSSGALRAWLVGPTTRYTHAVLGDNIEAEGFVVETGGRQLQLRLGPEAVFEDRRVRLIKMDSSSIPLALVVKAYQERGAALALYRLGPDKIEPLAESAPIGRPNRWLNPVGAADFTGSGEIMIAAVVTPHLSGSLRLYRLAGGSLREVARIDGYTNHIIGSRDLDLAQIVTTREGKPVIVIPTIDRFSIATVSFFGSQAKIVSRTPTSSRILTMSAAGNGTITLNFENGLAQAVSII